MIAGDWLTPDWPAAAHVRAVSTTRQGGVGTGLYAALNLSDYVGDASATVTQNRAYLSHALALPSAPHWLTQVHGTHVVTLNAAPDTPGHVVEGDASTTRTPGVVCVVQTADCLPILLCDRAGTSVAAVHAGWRGLAHGVIDAALAQMQVPPEQIIAWLGPAIGPDAFEVGDDVRDAFLQSDERTHIAFQKRAAGKWLADLYQLARLRLQRLDVAHVSGGGRCTVTENEQFFSYRRDGAKTGRMATLIWLTP